MLKKVWIYVFVASIFLYGCSVKEYTTETKYIKFAFSDSGAVVAFEDKSTGSNYLFAEQPAPILSVKVDGTLYAPLSCQFNDRDGELILTYDTGRTATVKIETKETHLTFELISLEPMNGVELVVWGPYPTIIGETIGETVGVVRNSEFAIGIQSLNVKTIGGYPNNENDAMPSYNIFEGDDYSDISVSDKDKTLYRGDTAKPEDFGSVLQAYCRDRSKERIISNWNHEKYVAPAYNDGGVTGSKIAMFGCPAGKALETIGSIELVEGLPHPVIDGEWGKTARTATAAYLIMPFGENTIDETLKYANKAGLRYLYHGGPFQTWGHFKLHPNQFPDGVESMRRCVEKAADAGVYLGVHTLSNFITTNDPYVTPVPDPRLARVGTSTLTADIDPEQTEIIIEDPTFFNQMKNNNLKTVVVGNELIRYGVVSDDAPFTLIDCVRGAFGTAPSAHSAGDEIGKLADHGYKTFLTNADLQDEIAVRLADLFNKTGLRQISFDGLEGCFSSGMGQYARTLFTKKWFDNLSDDLRGKVINDASNPGHYFWHIYTRMNWGEPWYAGFRESQTQYRMKNQKFFRRNLMPGMLGWFRMTRETSLEDIEWLLARSAGYDAGYALVTEPAVIAENGIGEELLETIRQWENARLSGSFSDAQKLSMEEVEREFHLETISDTEWMLHPVTVSRFKHEKKIRQPGEPVFSSFTFDNPGKKQELQWIFTAVDGALSDITIEIDNYKKIAIPVSMDAGDICVYRGGDEAVLYDKTWHVKAKTAIDPSSMVIGDGEHSIVFDCGFKGGDKPFVKIELRTVMEAEPVGN